MEKKIMSSIEIRNFNNPDETNTKFNNAKIDAVNVGGQRVNRLTLQPGWKWSVDVKPNVGGDSCQASHLGIVHSGTIHCVCDDGSEASYTEGDVYSIKPGHDAWVVGDEQCVVTEFAGIWGE